MISLDTTKLDFLFKIIIAIAPSFYLLTYFSGMMYHSGYLEPFGLDNSLLPRSVENTLLMGFVYFSIAIINVSLFVIFWAVIVFLAFVFRPTLVSWVERLFSRVRRFLAEHTTFDIEKKKKSAIEQPPSWLHLVTAFLIGIIALVILIYILGLWASNDAQKYAREDMKAFSLREDPYVSVIAKPPLANTEAMQIVCSTKHCAFWNGENAIVLQQKEIVRIVTHLPEPKKTPSNEPTPTPSNKPTSTPALE